MTPRSSMLLIAAAAAVGVLLVGWNHRRLRAQERTVVTAAPRDDEAARALNRARMQLAGAELVRDEQRAVLARERGASLPTGTSARPPAETDTFQRILHDPEVNLLHIEALRAARALKYAPLVHALRLTPEQAAELDRILGGKELRDMDVYASGRSQGLTSNHPALAALNQEVEAETERDLRALLGDDGYAAFREHDRSASLRLTVSGMAGAATQAGQPFTPAQSERLVQILAESTPGFAAGQRVKASQVDWMLADPRIQEVLTPAQWEVIRATEPGGPKGIGGRFFPMLTAAIRVARDAEADAAAGSAP